MCLAGARVHRSARGRNTNKSCENSKFARCEWAARGAARVSHLLHGLLLHHGLLKLHGLRHGLLDGRNGVRSRRLETKRNSGDTTVARTVAPVKHAFAPRSAHLLLHELTEGPRGEARKADHGREEEAGHLCFLLSPSLRPKKCVRGVVTEVITLFPAPRPVHRARAGLTKICTVPFVARGEGLEVWTCYICSRMGNQCERSVITH